MSEDFSKLPKGLFGYRRAIVNQILEDRDIMVRSAEDRVQRSESRVSELESELGSVKSQNARLEEQLGRLGQQFEALSARLDESTGTTSPEPVSGGIEERPPAAEPRVISSEPSTASQLMAEELTSILLAGQEAAARMIERARDEAQRQIVEANRLLGDVHQGVKQFGAWREDIQPVITRVQSMIEAVRAHISTTPERVQQALAPLAEAMLAVDVQLLDLAGVARSPFTDGAEDGVVEVPEGGTSDDRESSWVAVEEGQVSVSESDQDQVRLEASTG
jgi:chromosome segregation ATPase